MKFYWHLLIIMLAFLPVRLCAKLPGRPNIILIIVDDQGYGDLSCYPHQVPVSTPNIDALAASGIRFTNGYATHHGCAPSRAAILSGRQQQRLGFYDIWEVQKGMPATENLLPAYLHHAGYRTGLIGKWHLGEKKYNHPLQKGYDRFFGFLGGMHDYYKPGIGDSWEGGGLGHAPVYSQYDTVKQIKYLTDELTDQAIDFVNGSAGQPFFLHLAYNAPHSPWQAPEKDIDAFAETPEPYRQVRALNKSLDDNIGRLLTCLDQQKMRANTLIFYISDNGGTKAHHNSNLRGSKGTLFEGGIRVPFMISYPVKLPAGKTYTEPVSGLDIFPSILAAANIPLPNDKTLDGLNLLPFLTGQKSYSPHEKLYWSWDPFFGYWAVRDRKWKAIHEKIDGVEVIGLYDLEADVSETKNLIKKYPDTFRELERSYSRWISQMPPSMVGDDEWTPNGNGWKYKYGTGKPASDSIHVHKTSSRYQKDIQEIRVLLPDTYSPNRKYRALYVLPVGQGKGSALKYFRDMDLHNRYDLLLVEMTFEKTPWFGNHVTDTTVRQENYVRDFVVPFVEERYSTTRSAEGRLLIGFSKSGWGAFSLILRNPHFFGYAAAWDAPWMMDSLHYKTDEVFGTHEQMDLYRPDLLTEKNARYFKKKNRLVLAGEDIWGKRFPPPSGRSHTEEYHLLLLKRRMRHTYRPDLPVKHSWHKDWIVPVVKELMLLVDQKPLY